MNIFAINDRLKDLRKKRGLTQEAIASVLGVTQANYNRIERHVHLPLLSHIITLKKFYGTTYDYLLDGYEAPESKKGAEKMSESDVLAQISALLTKASQDQSVIANPAKEAISDMIQRNHPGQRKKKL